MIYLGKVTRAIKKTVSSTTKAPGPDGIRLITWKLVTREILEWIQHLFNMCLIYGEFPLSWKEANLVLIPKDSRPSTSAAEVPKDQYAF